MIGKQGGGWGGRKLTEEALGWLGHGGEAELSNGLGVPQVPPVETGRAEE